jgi:NitT/TauT family transport system substrate-binding protein
MGAKDAGLETAADLNDVEIGISSNTVIEYFVDIVLEGQGVVNQRKTSVPQIPVRMELLRSGQLKAASMPDPLATVVIKAGAVILADSRDMQLDPAVLIFTDKTIEEQKGVLKAFFIAYNKAADAINADPERYRPLLLEKGRFPENVIADIEIPHFRKATEPDVEEVKRIVNWAREKGLGKKNVAYSDLVYKGLF